MVTVPVSFQYKGVQGLQTHGIVRDDRGRQEDNRRFEELSMQVEPWLEPLDETLFLEGDRQTILDAMKEPVEKLIELLPADELKKQFHENFEPYVKGALRKKTLSKKGMKMFLVRKLLKLLSKEEKDWYKKVSGLRGEQRIYEELQRQCSDQPCLLINGFSEKDLIKVVKSKLQKKGKCSSLNEESAYF